ncbi:MAG TPA: flagellar basal body L-ring protein FlgH [Rhodobacteraceae bacterium]|nr:flagellar basal body L-ring protein FlgH [Paracoccaceae bacterium]
MPKNPRLILVSALLVTTACAKLDNVGKTPALSPIDGTTEQYAMMSPALPQTVGRKRAVDNASLWNAGRRSLLGDRRAMQKGDILTVMIEIDDKAEISNSTARTRKGAEKAGIPNLLGIPQRINEKLPSGASMDTAFETNSNSSFSGDGSVRRKEKLTLKVAATVIDVLPNGILAIQGSQEVRVNFEIRELLVTGYVRPEDISRQNQITYDKIASARISYGGRGQISDVQQPRYGQQVADIILPF